MGNNNVNIYMRMLEKKSKCKHSENFLFIFIFNLLLFPIDMLYYVSFHCNVYWEKIKFLKFLENAWKILILEILTISNILKTLVFKDENCFL
jgi:hypothetical protein